MIDFLSPLPQDFIRFVDDLSVSTIGKQIAMYTEVDAMPDLEHTFFALVGVRENRASEDVEIAEELNLEAVRKAFYGLYPGNWIHKIADIGDIPAGHTREDSMHALRAVVSELLRLNVIPIILGGPQDMCYGQYRGYNHLGKMVNITNIDSRFDIGNSDMSFNNKSYIGKIIVGEPFNLFNYAVLGYQSFLNPPEEIALMDKLYFDAYRLGDVTADISLAEPVFRNSDIVTLDVTAINANSMRYKNHNSPNGFDGREICALARYAGISNQVRSFGVYELANTLKAESAMLVAQILWYFIEGVNFRMDDEDFQNESQYTTYVVPLEEEQINLIFLKSNKSERWWMELPFEGTANKYSKQTLLPCTQQDYITACNQEIPEKWLKARLKNEIYKY